MPSPDSSQITSLPSEEELAALATQLAELRTRVAAAQAQTGVADPALIAEFAQVQRTFLDGRIRLEQMRMAGLLRDDAAAQESPEEKTEAAPVILLPEDNAAKDEGERRVLKASTPFWLTVIVLLAAMVCFQHSPYCYSR